ncbi:MAG: serine protease, partial [Elusimicrobia bacterium]|nr:serine protease [Elusimicrobiota bacterium]
MRPLLTLLSVLCLAPGLSARGLAMRSVTPRGPLEPDELATIGLFKQATKSVVFVTNIGAVRDEWTLDVVEYPQGAGSGFLWDEAGHVVTNFHVVRGGAELAVTLTDHATY